MQRDIVEHRVNAILLEFVQHALAIDLRREKNVVQVPVVLTFRGHDGPTKQAVLLEWCERFVVTLPNRHPLPGNAVRLFKLRPEERSDDVARQKRRTDVLPGVFVDFAPEKPATVRSFFADDFGAQPQISISQKKAAPFT